MYKCSDCGRIFDEPIEQLEYTEFWGVPGWSGFYVSPCCQTGFDEIPDDNDFEVTDYAF